MTIKHRAFQDNRDLSRIGALLRRAFAISPSWNGWSFARYDIWAQRHIGEDQVHGRQGWQQGFRLWEDDGGNLVGAAFFDGPHRLVMVSDPEARGLEGSMLDWGEARYLAQAADAPQLELDVMDSHTYLAMLLRHRGYKKADEHMIFRGKWCQPDQPPPLPKGYTIKPIESDADLEQFFAGVAAVFNFHDTVPVYRLVQQAPSYVPQLDLMLLDPAGQLASFCSLWQDVQLGLAEFEPVGTVPAFRRRGLGALLLRHAESRLAAIGCRRLSVCSGSESVPANALYQSVGLVPIDSVNSWRLPSRRPA